MIDQSANKLAAVLGWPISHSKSPLIHGYWLKRYRIKGEYMAIPVPDNFLSMTIECLRDFEFSGFNVTLPHKESITPYLDHIDDTAKAIGAVNTVIRQKDGRLYGTNTDKEGFLKSIESVQQIDKALVLGAGGASRAILAGLRERGAEIFIANRTKEKADNLAHQFGATSLAWQDKESLLPEIDLLVNTTSLGMGVTDKEFSPYIDLSDLKKSATVTDIVYTPLKTPLLVQAEEKGHDIIDGLWMLLYQAAPAFEAFFGYRPQIDADLRQQVIESLKSA